MNSRNVSSILITSFATLSLASSAFAQVTVLSVPWVPATPTTPHTTYPINSTTETTIVLGATVPSAVGSADSFTFRWSFGDGTTSSLAAVTNPYDLSATHQYPPSAATGTQWTATVTVTDTTTSKSGSAKYYVIQEANNLSSRVNVAIDRGLWYLHQTMWRNTTTVGMATVNWGGWDTQTYACNNVNSAAYDCIFYGSINAENTQAFEVNGHQQNGPSTDPYTDDVARGVARALYFVATEANVSTAYQYNPAKAAFICADGSVPQTSDSGACTGHGGQHQYNPSATSCTAPPCTYTFDGNKDGMMAYSNDGSGEYTYTTSPFLDMLVASGTPNAKATTGSVVGMTFQNIIQDILDFYGYSQYNYNYDVAQGYTRGNSQYAGGGWLYGPQQGDDNSTSQWAAIAYISGQRGSGISIPPIITDTNQVWVTNAQDLTDPKPGGADPYSSGDNYGSFGYRGSLAYSNSWGPFAVTPSGSVQMAMDGIGRTPNTTLGDSTTAFDQRWNNAETYYADNFCNSVANGPVYAPRAYIYGMFSFTKSMLLHNISGALSPIQYLRTQTPNVFTGNSKVPADTIDWYAAQSTASGGADPCDGIAQTLVNYQSTPGYGSADGHWYGNDYYGTQFNYETAWALIMLQRTVFVTCVNNLAGQGVSSSGTISARVDLSWSNQANSTSYNVLRGSTGGGPYTLVGKTSSTSFTDTTKGLTNGDTYFYVVQPVNGSTEVCQSNQATITVPNLTGRH
jgi:hypothetical protein